MHPTRARRVRPSRLVVAFLVFWMLAGPACGDGGDATQADPPEVPTTPSPRAASEQLATTSAAAATTEVPATTSPPETTQSEVVGEAGSFTLNGEEFVVTLLNRCVPFQDVDGNLDLQALAQGSSIKLNLYLTGDVVEVSVDGSGLQETYGSIAFGDDPQVHDSAVTGDRWTGSATVGDSLDTAEPVEITWDVMVPAEAQDCSF